jgi:hypothetical protein
VVMYMERCVLYIVISQEELMMNRSRHILSILMNPGGLKYLGVDLYNIGWRRIVSRYSRKVLEEDTSSLVTALISGSWGLEAVHRLKHRTRVYRSEIARL